MKFLITGVLACFSLIAFGQSQEATPNTKEEKIEATCNCFNDVRASNEAMQKKATSAEELDRLKRANGKSRMKCFKLQHEMSQTIADENERISFMQATNTCADNPSTEEEEKK